MEYTLFLEKVHYSLLFYHHLIKYCKTFFLIVSYKYRLYLHYNVMSRRFHLRGSHPPHDVMAVLLLLISQGIVVEPSAIRGLVADCPIFIIFKHSHLGLFHPYVVVNESLRGFQQFTLKGQIFYPH